MIFDNKYQDDDIIRLTSITNGPHDTGNRRQASYKIVSTVFRNSSWIPDTTITDFLNIVEFMRPSGNLYLDLIQLRARLSMSTRRGSHNTVYYGDPNFMSHFGPDQRRHLDNINFTFEHRSEFPTNFLLGSSEQSDCDLGMIVNPKRGVLLNKNWPLYFRGMWY